MSSLEIVQSVPADAAKIGEIRAANWEEQYARLDGVTAEWMKTEVERISGAEGTRSRAYWIEQALQPDAQNHWLSARVTGSLAIIGFMEARKHQDGTQELRSLHLRAGQRGMGAGQALMDKAQSEWLDPVAATYLDVAEVNRAGQRFYQRLPNNYRFTEHGFMYGPVSMLQMVRPAPS
jgi:ribosomal protein S18 acetylase RimI-like enzyme